MHTTTHKIFLPGDTFNQNIPSLSIRNYLIMLIYKLNLFIIHFQERVLLYA